MHKRNKSCKMDQNVSNLWLFFFSFLLMKRKKSWKGLDFSSKSLDFANKWKWLQLLHHLNLLAGKRNQWPAQVQDMSVPRVRMLHDSLDAQKNLCTSFSAETVRLMGNTLICRHCALVCDIFFPAFSLPFSQLFQSLQAFMAISQLPGEVPHSPSIILFGIWLAY